MLRLLIFIVWPLIEIALFIRIGGLLGVGATLIFVLASALLGIGILRREVALGVVLLNGLRVERNTRRPGVPGGGVLRAIAGILLIIPGFFGSAAGLLLLLPPIQRGLVTLVLQKLSASGSNVPPPDEEVIDGEWHVVRTRRADGENDAGHRSGRITHPEDDRTDE